MVNLSVKPVKKHVLTDEEMNQISRQLISALKLIGKHRGYQVRVETVPITRKTRLDINTNRRQ